MPTGLLIRDLHKTYRELRFADSGSIALTEIEHNAYSHRLTVEITHYDAPRAINEKTLPTNTHWGYLTSFKGSSVLSSQAIKFARQRVYQGINTEIWAYHQATESLSLSTAATEAGVNALIAGGVLGDAVDAVVRLFVKAKDAVGDLVDNAANWLVGSRPFETGENDNPIASYTAFPIISPFPDIFKFKSDIPVSFLFRLESFYLVNPAVYILANPSETGDETEGEDQYPSPQAGDGDGAGNGFPPSDPNPEGSDPRDFGANNPGQVGSWSVNLAYSDPGGNPACNDVPPINRVLPGYSNSPPILRAEPPGEGETKPTVYIRTPLASLPVARDCAIAIVGEPVFTPPENV